MFFFSTSFPKIIFFIFYAFVVYEPAEQNFIFLTCWEHKTWKINFLPGWISSSMTVSLSQRSYRVFSSTLNFAWQFSYQWNRRHAILPQTQICKFGRTKFDTHTILSCDKVLISLIIPLQVLLSSWRSAWKVQLCSLGDLAFHLQNCRIQQKLQETHKICLWLEGKRSSHIKGIRLSVIQFNRNYMKLTKFGTLVNKTTSLFISIRDSKISRGCAKILEIPEGRGGG